MHTGFADPAFVAMQQNGYLSLKPNGKPFFEARAMTTIDYAARTVAARPSLFDTVRTVFEAPALFLKRRFVVANTRNELTRLSDAQLDDIGLIRSEIDAISAEMAARTIL